MHAPTTHPGYWQWALQKISEFDPHILVNGGDWFEGLAASRWPKTPEQDWFVRKEFVTVSEQADDLAQAAPNAKKYWQRGNHDSNLLDEPHRLTDEMKAYVGELRNDLFTGPLKSWTVGGKYGHDEKLRLGPITFQHGCATGRGIPESHLKDQAYAYCVPWGLHLSVHTHAPVPVTQARERSSWLPYWFANAGTGMDWSKAHYMERASKEAWGRGLVLFEVNEASVKNRKPHYAAREWSCELLTHSFASQNRSPMGPLPKLVGPDG
ncbi:hypothetical protein EON79_22995, partial [bacterium]